MIGGTERSQTFPIPEFPDLYVPRHITTRHAEINQTTSPGGTKHKTLRQFKAQTHFVQYCNYEFTAFLRNISNLIRGVLAAFFER